MRRAAAAFDERDGADESVKAPAIGMSKLEIVSSIRKQLRLPLPSAGVTNRCRILPRTRSTDAVTPLDKHSAPVHAQLTISVSYRSFLRRQALGVPAPVGHQ